MEHKEKILSKERLVQKALNSAQIGVWYWNMDIDEIIINDTLAEIIGFSVSEVHLFKIKYWLRICHPEDQKLMVEKFSQFRLGEMPHFSMRSRIRHKNGSWVWVQVNGGITETDSLGNPSAISGIITDISELYHSKSSLLYRYRIEKLVSEISLDFVGIHTHDIDFVINQSIKKIAHFLAIDRCYVFRFRRNNSRMDNTHEWCTEGVKPEIGNLQNIPTSVFPWWMKKMNKYEHIYIRQVKDLPDEASAERELLHGQSIISLLVVPIHFQEKLIGFIGFDSVREEKEWLEADIYMIENVAHTMASAFNARMHQEILLETIKKAEESDRVKSAFLATINHELRTPLHHILGFSDLLRTNNIPVSETANFAEKIYNSGKNLLHIIEDILYLSFADEAYVRIREENVKGGDLFLQHKNLLEAMLGASTKGNSIHLKFSQSVDFAQNHFLSDVNKINQVIVNLMKNAIKFTETGFIEYAAEVQNNRLIFRIKDSGVGIPQHQQKLIFDFFRQADNSSTRIYNGIGVGLSISKKVAKILKGELSVLSIPTKGTTFTFEVPVTPVADLRKIPQRNI